jgi:hypothetical protein
MKYLQPSEFKDFCTNQEKLIEILNHRMTGIEKSMFSIKTDVSWLKKLLWVMVGMSVSIFGSVLIKLLMGVT